MNGHQGPAKRCLIGLLTLGITMLNGCGMHLPGQQDGPGRHRDVSHVPDAVPRVEPRSRGGNASSYVVFGKRYYTLKSSQGFRERGIASWYGKKFHGRKTSNGETYDMYVMSAAHKRLPIPTYLQVTNLENGRSVVVRVNDRGPFHENRIIDLSYAAASRIGMLGKGTALVEIRAIDPAAPGKPRLAAKPPRHIEPRPATRPPAGSRGPVAKSLPAPTPAPRIYLQAGAFGDRANAERLQGRLEKGLSRGVRINHSGSTKGAIHRVQVGPLASVEIADKVSEQLHGLGISAPLVVID